VDLEALKDRWLGHWDESGRFCFLNGFVRIDPLRKKRVELMSWEPGDEARVKTRAEVLRDSACETGIGFICAIPGGGKSWLATKFVVDELMHGERTIVTNLALKINHLQSYLDSLGAKVHVMSRVRLLERDEVMQFYRIRNAHGLAMDVTMERKNGVMWPTIDYDASQDDDWAAGGVLYIIDEVHNFWNRKMKLEEDSPEFAWASQHRKLKDQCWFVTQSIENVHVMMRRLGARFLYCRADFKRKFKGFRVGGGFVVTEYPSIATPGSEPIDQFPMEFDTVGLGSCYSTAAGVGVSAKGNADGGSKVKGLPLWTVWIMLTVIVVAVVGVLFLGPKLVVKATHAVLPSVVGGNSKTTVKGKKGEPLGLGASRAAVGESVDGDAGCYLSEMRVNGFRYVENQDHEFRLVRTAQGDRVFTEDGVFLHRETAAEKEARRKAARDEEAAEIAAASVPVQKK